MNKKIIFGIIILIIIILGLVKITQNNNLAPDTGVKDVSIAMVTFPGYGPLYLAQKKGFFGDLNVDLKRIESLSDIRSAMSAGQVDMAVMTYDMYQSVKDQQPNGKAFVVIDTSHGGDGIVVSGDINTIQDFRGKKIGAEPGFPPYLILLALLNEQGMTLQDVDFQDLPTTDAGNAFVAKRLDIAALYEPSLSASAKSRPGSKVLMTSADEQVKGLAQDLIFANEKFAKENPEVLIKVAEGYFKAVDYIKTNPDESYEIMGKAFNVTPAEMKDFATGISWPNRSENIQLFDKKSDVNVYKTFNLVGDLLEKNNETNIRVNPDNALIYDIVSQTK